MSRPAFLEPNEANVALVQRRIDRARGLGRALLTPFARLSVEGADHLPRSGPLLVVVNHTSAFDPWTVSAASPRALHWMGTETVFRPGPFGRLLHDFGAIPKKRFVRDLRALRLATRWARAGGAVAVFPEGERTWLGPQQPHVPGMGAFARAIGAPIVACVVENGYRHAPRWARTPRTGALHVRFGAPIDPTGWSDADLEAWMVQALDVDPAGRPDLPAWTTSRASGLPNVIFGCDRCGAFDSMSARRHHLSCGRCGHVREVDGRLRLVDDRGPLLLPDAVSHLQDALFSAFGQGPWLTSAPTVARLAGRELRGRLVLYADRLAVEDGPHTLVSVGIPSIRNINVEFHDQLFVHAGDATLSATIPTGSAAVWPWAARWAASR